MTGKRKLEAGIVLLLLFVVLLGGAGRSGETQTYPITRVTVILPHGDDGYWRNIEEGILEKKDAAAAYGIDLKIIIPQLNYNNEQMTDLLKQQIAAKVDVIMVQGNEDPAFLEALYQAYDRGIRVVLIDTDLESFPEHLYVGTNNYQAGRLIGQSLVQTVTGETRVAVISGDEGYPNLEQRLAGLQDVIADYPQVRITQVAYDHYDGLTFMQKYHENRGAEILVCLEGTGAQTISRFFTEPDDSYGHIFGFDITDGIPGGVVDGVIMQDMAGIGRRVVEELIYYAEHASYSGDKIYTQIQWVTKENFETVQVQ